MTNSHSKMCTLNAFEDEAPHAKSSSDLNQPAMFEDSDLAVAKKRKASERLSDSEHAGELLSDLCVPDGRDHLRVYDPNIDCQFVEVEDFNASFVVYENCEYVSIVTGLPFQEFKSQRVKVPKSAKQKARLTVRGLAGNKLGQFEISLMRHVQDLKQLVSSNCDIPVELLQFVGPNGRETLRDRQPLWFYKLKNGECITCIQLPIPQGFERVGECDYCWDARHLFYCYTKDGRHGTCVAVCETCVGTMPRFDPKLFDWSERPRGDA